MQLQQRKEFFEKLNFLIEREKYLVWNFNKEFERQLASHILKFNDETINFILRELQTEDIHISSSQNRRLTSSDIITNCKNNSGGIEKLIKCIEFAITDSNQYFIGLQDIIVEIFKENFLKISGETRRKYLNDEEVINTLNQMENITNTPNLTINNLNNEEIPALLIQIQPTKYNKMEYYLQAGIWLNADNIASLYSSNECFDLENIRNGQIDLLITETKKQLKTTNFKIIFIVPKDLLLEQNFEIWEYNDNGDGHCLGQNFQIMLKYFSDKKEERLEQDWKNKCVEINSKKAICRWITEDNVIAENCMIFSAMDSQDFTDIIKNSIAIGWTHMHNFLQIKNNIFEKIIEYGLPISIWFYKGTKQEDIKFIFLEITNELQYKTLEQLPEIIKNLRKRKKNNDGNKKYNFITLFYDHPQYNFPSSNPKKLIEENP